MTCELDCKLPSNLPLILNRLHLGLSLYLVYANWSSRLASWSPNFGMLFTLKLDQRAGALVFREGNCLCVCIADRSPCIIDSLFMRLDQFIKFRSWFPFMVPCFVVVCLC